MVRRAASQRLGEFAKVCELEHIKGSDPANKGVLMQIYTDLATDEQVCFVFLKCLLTQDSPCRIACVY